MIRMYDWLGQEINSGDIICYPRVGTKDLRICVVDDPYLNTRTDGKYIIFIPNKFGVMHQTRFSSFYRSIKINPTMLDIHNPIHVSVASYAIRVSKSHRY